jgi:hypothetical protein
MNSGAFTLKRTVRVGSVLALIGALALTSGLLVFIDSWFGRGQGPYATLTGGGLLAAAAVPGSLWRDRMPVRVLRRSLVVLALLALIVGTGFLALGWLGVWTRHSGQLLGPGWAASGTTGRVFGTVLILPLTGCGRLATRCDGPARETTIHRGGRVHAVCFRGYHGNYRDRRCATRLRTLLRAGWTRTCSRVDWGALFSGSGRGGHLPRVDQAVRHRLRQGRDAGTK